MFGSLLTASLASAQTYNFAVSEKFSAVETAFDLTAPLAGTFIGNFDATTNPGGTLTLPGPVGGSGNNPIAYSATVEIGASLSTPPLGSFQLSVDSESLLVEVSGLALDLLGGDSIAVAGTLTLSYSTFHTQQPSAIFFGGFPIPIPIPTIAEITALTAVQSGLGAGTLIEQSPGVFTFTALVPVELSASIEISGEPAGGGAPLPAVLPLAGTLDLTGSGAILTAKTSGSASETLPLDPPLAFDSLPVPLPTILPPGGTANLLFGGELPSIALALESSISLTAFGSIVCVPADLNCDGVVDAADLGVMLAAWGGRGPADLNGDGIVNGADVGLLLGAWSV